MNDKECVSFSKDQEVQDKKTFSFPKMILKPRVKLDWDTLRIQNKKRIISCKWSCSKVNKKFGQIRDIELKRLTKSIKFIKGIKDIDFNFERSYKVADVTDIGMDRINEACKRLVALKHVGLNFNMCHKITDQGLASLNNLLKNLSHLTRISLKK